MTGENLDKLLDNVDEVAHLATETREENDVLEATPTTTNPSAEIATPMVTVSGIPPLDVVLPTSEPVESDHTATQASPPPSKRRRLVLRLATQSVTASQTTQSVTAPPTIQSVTAPPTITPVIVSTEPVSEGPSTFYEAGGSSFPTGFSHPRTEDDAALIRLPRLLAEKRFSTPPPHDKGISIGGDRSGEEISSILGLQKQIDVLNQKNIDLDQRNIELTIKVADLQTENIELNIQVAELNEDKALKTKQITDLQTHFGLLTASYYDLKKKLEEKLGDEFKSSVD